MSFFPLLLRTFVFFQLLWVSTEIHILSRYNVLYVRCSYHRYRCRKVAARKKKKWIHSFSRSAPFPPYCSHPSVVHIQPSSQTLRDSAATERKQIKYESWDRPRTNVQLGRKVDEKSIRVYCTWYTELEGFTRIENVGAKWDSVHQKRSPYVPQKWTRIQFISFSSIVYEKTLEKRACNWALRFSLKLINKSII